MAQHYPIFLSLTGRVCLVVGGGAVGERKIRGLLQCGASIRLVASDLTEWLEDQKEQGHIEHVGQTYQRHHLDGADLVFAATSNPEINQTIAADAHGCRLWCNMASDPTYGSFIVPSIVQQGPLSIAISTGGLSPAIAKLIRTKLESQFGPEWVIFLNLMGLLRVAVQAMGLASAANQQVFRDVSSLPLLDWIKARDREASVEAMHEACQYLLTIEELRKIWDEAWKQSS